ncbi:PDZ domain-containing protein [Aurantivibrio plasticivorans]
MKHTVITALVGISVGLLISVFAVFRPDPSDAVNEENIWTLAEVDTTSAGRDKRDDAIAVLEERVAVLERELRDIKERPPAPLARRTSLNSIGDENGDEAELAADDEESTVDSLSQSERQKLERAQRLSEAGFAADQVEQILVRERELQIANLHETWSRRRAAFLESPEEFDVIANNALRRELGDADYERYLEANGRATSVPVARLFEGSAAALAGLQTGDRIIGFDGQRTFNLRELNRVSVQGEKGETVLIEVLRDGARLQFAVERGPLGIGTRRGRRGF